MKYNPLKTSWFWVGVLFAAPMARSRTFEEAFIWTLLWVLVTAVVEVIKAAIRYVSLRARKPS